jgi:hypothetical protein
MAAMEGHWAQSEAVFSIAADAFTPDPDTFVPYKKQQAEIPTVSTAPPSEVDGDFVESTQEISVGAAASFLNPSPFGPDGSAGHWLQCEAVSMDGY